MLWNKRVRALHSVYNKSLYKEAQLKQESKINTLNRKRNLLMEKKKQAKMIERFESAPL